MEPEEVWRKMIQDIIKTPTVGVGNAAFNKPRTLAPPKIFCLLLRVAGGTGGYIRRANSSRCKDMKCL